jgi:hypothetical protein
MLRRLGEVSVSRKLSKQILFVAGITGALFLFSSSAVAEQLISDVQFLVPNKTVDLEVLAKAKDLLHVDDRFELEDQVVTGDVPVRIQGITMYLQYQMNPMKTTVTGRQYSLSVQSLSSQIAIDRVLVKGTISKMVGGVLVRVKVDAECRNIQAELNPGTQLSLDLNHVVDNNFSAMKIANFNMSMPVSLWKVQPIQCVRLKGLDMEVLKKIEDSLANQEELKKYVKDFMQEKLDQNTFNWSDIRELPMDQSPEKNPGQVQGWLSPENTKFVTGGLQIRGRLVFSSMKNLAAAPHVVTFKTLPVTSMSNRATLPKEFFSGLIQLMAGTGFFDRKNQKVQDNADLKKLFNERSYQGTVWEDLENFPLKSDFRYDILTNPETEVLETRKLVVYNNKTIQGLEIPLKFWADATMFAPKNNNFERYAVVRQKNTVKVQMVFQDDKKIRIAFFEPNPIISVFFDSDYVKKYKTNTKVGVSYLKDAVIQMFYKTNVFLDVPDLNITDSTKLLNPKFTVDGDFVQVDFAQP